MIDYNELDRLLDECNSYNPLPGFCFADCKADVFNFVKKALTEAEESAVNSIRARDEAWAEVKAMSVKVLSDVRGDPLFIALSQRADAVNRRNDLLEKLVDIQEERLDLAIRELHLYKKQ